MSMSDVPQRAIVTGAAGGIGTAIARRLASAGVGLALFDRRTDLLDDVTAECAALVPTFAFAVDQTKREAVEEGVAAAIEALGGLDILVANAGYGKFATFLDQPLGEWQRHVDVNLTGTFHVCQVGARAMVAQQTGGAIVVNASSGAVQYTDLLSAYCATKAGLAMLVKGMASELGPYGIRANAVLPGVIETGMTAPMLGGTDAHRQPMLARTPAGRLGVPDDVAALVAFLASRDAGFITGQSVSVDGGQTLKGQPQWYVADYRDGAAITWEPGA